MGAHRTAWHLMATVFIDERRPRAVQLLSDVRLTVEPQRADLLLIRKHDGPIDDATAFFRLWALMGSTALVEYKSRSRPARAGVWSQLLGYAHLYARDRRQEVGGADDLSLFLMVHDITPTLHEDAKWLKSLEIGESEGAYTPVYGTPFPIWIVSLNQLAVEEGEPLIGELGSRTVSEEDVDSLSWLAHFFMANEKRARHLEDFEELKAEFMKSQSFLEMTQERFLEGRREGRLEGRLEAEGAILLRLLERRFGQVPDAVRARVLNADSDQLLRWGDRLFDASSLEAIFTEDS